MRYHLQCKSCGARFAGSEGLYQCRECGGKLEVRYSDDVIRSSWIDTSKPGIWKFWRLLPVDNPDKTVSLGEGNTFLHECKSLSRKFGFAKLWVKDEGKNPTGSFKDRNAAVSVTKAVEFKAKTVAIASDGNAGPAVAAYAAKAGLPCYVFMPTSTAPQDMARAAVFGAQVIKIRGKGLVNDCITLVEALRTEFGWHHLTTAGPVNPYQLEAPKTIAYEIALELDGNMPDWMAIPAGGGGLLVAIFRALNELEHLELIDRVPRILCVQSEACAPIVKAFREQQPIELWRDPGVTKAVPIAVPLPLEGDEVLQALQTTQGAAITVSDQEILEAQKMLAVREGVYASPAGIAALAGTLKARDHGVINDFHTVLVVITGSGVKDLGAWGSSLADQLPEVAAKPELVKQKLFGANLTASPDIPSELKGGGDSIYSQKKVIPNSVVLSQEPKGSIKRR